MFVTKLVNNLKPANVAHIQKTLQLNHCIRSTLNVQNVRLLYSHASLGLDGFLQASQTTQRQLENMGDKFKEKMSDFIEKDNNAMVFTEDLKNMIYISQNDNDIDLVVKMIKKFNQQNKELRFGSFIFGPVVMRLFHHHNKADLALECFKSPELDGFFDQIISYQLLLDLLYENEKYNEVLECFQFIKEKQLEGVRYPKNVVVLTMAACYKLNNKESLDYALKFWQELHDVGHIPMRRAITFCAALAYNQGNPSVALEILSSSRNQSYTTVRNLKIASLVDIGRIENVIPIMKSVFAEDLPEGQVHTFNREVIDKVKKGVAELDMATVTEEFDRIERMLEKNGQIVDASINDQLCQEIKGGMVNKKHFVPRYDKFEPRPNRNFRPRRFNNNQRPGLDELV
ncbi:unnamed protein product [Phyllotreta striolata]|uniref:Pentatricopeptide repeat-containing protein 2 n=1 Tax=Phyllotreta striolata TaxID=444603 RepID=A0A9N9TQI2_PHYSR|nr:unnamed protein product [Phyllotreta striolata]